MIWLFLRTLGSRRWPCQQSILEWRGLTNLTPMTELLAIGRFWDSERHCLQLYTYGWAHLQWTVQILVTKMALVKNNGPENKIIRHECEKQFSRKTGRSGKGQESGLSSSEMGEGRVRAVSMHHISVWNFQRTNLINF